MCGITGFFSYKNKINTKKYYEAHKKIAHRGPDDEGFIYKNENNTLEYLSGDDTIEELRNREHIITKIPTSMILGHRRLSIIDLTSHGHQPFVFETLSMVYNGEIYNYVELRDKLKNLGYSFETESDTEVFLKAYHCWGVDSFSKFNGMWAAAIYDTTNKDEIILTRDRFGIKPLYYSMVDDNLIFGSEIKFVSNFFEESEANEQMVYEYLRFNYIDHTSQTLFKNIFQVEPSTYMVYSKNDIKFVKYFDISDVNSSQQVVENYLKDSIKLRMRSDVEVGSLLSGGIDSSTILGLINSEKYTDKFQTFSAVFNEEEFSEKKYIDKFKTDNLELNKHFIYPKAEDLPKIIDELIYTQEEPFRSMAVFSQHEIYKYIKENTNTTVLLNGQGADEIFTGYTEYYYVYLLELLRTLNIKSFISEFVYFKNNRQITSIILGKQLLVSLVSQKFRKKDKYNIFNKDFKLSIKKEKTFNNFLKNSLWNSLTFSALREYLKYEDKNSMRFSLESRLPFLDYRLVQFAFSLKNGDKIKNGLSKVVLRNIAKDKIPEETLNRKDKMGFVSPQEIWQKTILKDEFDKVFQEINTDGLFDFINKKNIVALYQGYKNGNMSDWAMIWRLYLVYKWKVVWKIN